MAIKKALRDQRLFYSAETNKCALSLLYSLIRVKVSCLQDRNHAEQLVRKMISDYPIKPEEPFSIIGGSDKTLEEIYNEHPELNGITPERGYIYNEFVHRNYISRYVR